jgi:uncharacterized protein (DUF2267 family)
MRLRLRTSADAEPVPLIEALGMPTTQPTILDRSVQKVHIWLNDLCDELESDDRQYAYRVLRGFLQALRDRLPHEESAQLAAQLPVLLRGVYYENWVPSRTPQPYHDVRSFLDRMAAEASLAGETEASFAATAAARVLRAHVSAGEVDDVLAVLPPALHELLG